VSVAILGTELLRRAATPSSRACLSRRIAAAWAVAVLLSGAAPVRALDIPITIEELLPVGSAGVARSGAPLRFGVPLPAVAAVDSATPVALPGFPTPQIRPLAKHASGKWKWMLVETLADLGAGEKRRATLAVGSGGFAAGADLASAAANAIVVQTGAATFRIRRSGWNGLDGAATGAAEWIAGGHDLGLVAADSNGTVYASGLDPASEVAIESNGSLLAVVVARGHLVDATGAALLGYTARLRFARDRADVELELTLQNAEMGRPQPIYFRWAAFQVPLACAGSQSVAFGLNDGTTSAHLAPENGLLLYQGRTSFREDSKTARPRARLTADVGVLATAGDTLVVPGTLTDHLDGWLAVGGTTYSDPAGVALAVKDLAPLYPTGLRLGACAGGARILSYDILSPANTRTAPLLWAWGAHHTGLVVLGLGVAPRDVWAAAQFPIFARPDFEHVRSTGAIFGETRLVDLATEQAWFASIGKNYTTNPPSWSELSLRRYYDFGSTGGPNQYDENLTYVLDYLRAGQTGRMLQALQDASWKADQAVMHSDDFDYGTLAYGETDPEVEDPDGWNGRGLNTTFENEHPHWLTLPLLYWLTGNERLREASSEYCEWRRYRAGNRSYGPIYGKGMSSLRLWSRAWRDIALAWEFTREPRYYDDMVRMTEAVVSSREAPGIKGRSLTRGYLYVGDWSNAARPIRLFFLDAVHGTDSREAYRLLPDGALREDLRDYLVGLAYFTIETRLGSENIGFPYTYNLDAATTPGTRGDQIGLLMAHGWEWTGDPFFLRTSNELAWRTIVDEDWERGSESATLVRCWADLHQAERDVGWIRDLEIAGGDGTYQLRWTAPAHASEYIVKYAEQPLVDNLWFDAVTRTWRHDPDQYAPFWAAANVQGEPAPGAAGTRESMTISGLDPAKSWRFAVRYVASATVPEVDAPANLAASYDDDGRVVLSWTLPAGTVAARVVRNDSIYAGFACWPEDGVPVWEGAATSAADGTLDPGTVVKGSKHHYSVFGRDAAGRWSVGSRLAVTYQPPPRPPRVAAAAVPVSGEMPLDVTLTGTASDADGDLATQTWIPGDGADAVAGATTTHLYASAGTFAAVFTATDSSGLTASDTAIVQVEPAAPPVISVAASPSSGRAPLAVRFTAEVSDASAIADTTWAFSDGDSATGTEVTHTAAAGGRFVARFRAADVHGLAATDSVVLDLLPVDREAPVLVSRWPEPGATRVARRPLIAVSLADTACGVLADSVSLWVNGAQVAPVVTTNGGAATPGVSLSYMPASSFDYGAEVQVRIRAVDRAGARNVLDMTWAFQVDDDGAPPAITAASPAPGATGVVREAAIAVTIADTASGIDAASVVLLVNGTTVTPAVDGDATQLDVTWQPPGGFAYSSQVTVRLRAADRATTPNILDSTWSFQVEMEPKLVNFQPASFVVPPGYRADAGAVYSAARGYGWFKKTSVEARGSIADPRLGSYAYVTNTSTATWQLAVPPGRYAVALAVGSPTYTGLHRVELEGQVIVNGVATGAATGAGQFHQVTGAEASVTDGFLTIVIGGIKGSTKKTKLCYVDVRSAASEPVPAGDGTGREAVDRDPPHILAISPGPGATGVAPGTEISVTVADSASGIDTTTVNLQVGGATVAATTEGGPGAGASLVLSWSPSGGFTPGSTVTVHLRAADLAATPNTRDSTWSFGVASAPSEPSPPAVAALVNFQPASFATPAGYQADTGLAFDAARGYGWVGTVGLDASGTDPDPRLRSIAYIVNTSVATWQLAVPSGRYAVTVVVGSPTWTGLHRVQLEGTVVVNNVATTAGQFYQATNVPVDVADGFLSLAIGGISGSSKKTKLCYVDVRSASSAVAGLGSPPESEDHGTRLRLRLDFQPEDCPTPAGWTAVGGGAFDIELGRGWDRPVATGRARTRFGPVRNTWVEVENDDRPATFTALVPNGTYRVALVAGSPSHTGMHEVEVEGVRAVRGAATKPGGFVEVRDLEVRVVDGGLSVVLGGTGGRGKTKLCALEIESAGTGEPEGEEPAAAAATAALGRPDFALRVLRQGARLSPQVEFTAPIAAPLRLDVYDVRGRRVRRLWNGPMPGTRLRVEWDRSDDRGHPVAAGMYFVHAELARRSFNGKLLVVW
jgi:hypothetical protein